MTGDIYEHCLIQGVAGYSTNKHSVDLLVDFLQTSPTVVEILCTVDAGAIDDSCYVLRAQNWRKTYHTLLSPLSSSLDFCTLCRNVGIEKLFIIMPHYQLHTSVIFIDGKR